MKAPKPLKELPGFDDAMAKALHYKGRSAFAAFGDVGDVVIPTLRRVADWDFIWQLALIIGMEKEELSRRHLRLIPPPRLAANDCEGPNG